MLMKLKDVKIMVVKIKFLLNTSIHIKISVIIIFEYDFIFYFQGKDYELILAVEMETRHHIQGQFGSEFPAICNNCGVMAACNRKTWKFCEHF